MQQYCKIEQVSLPSLKIFISSDVFYTIFKRRNIFMSDFYAATQHNICKSLWE